MTKITKRHDDTSPDVLACLARAPVEDYEGYDYVMLTPYEAIMVQRLVSTCYERIAELEAEIAESAAKGCVVCGDSVGTLRALCQRCYMQELFSRDQRIAELEAKCEMLLLANDAWQQETDNE